MCPSKKTSVGAWIAIAVAVTISVLTSFGAFAQDRLSVARQGDSEGRTVVFVPGLATPGSVFEPYAAQRVDLDAHLVTIAGFGGLPALDPADGVIRPAAQALAAYLDEQALDDVVLVGHSLGAQVALVTAGQATERVAHVVVVDSLPFFQGMINPDADPAMVRAQGEAMMPALVGMERSAFMAMIEQGAPAQAASSEHQAQVVEYVAQSDQPTVAQATFEALSLDWRPGLEAVQAAVTVLVPHNDYLQTAPEVIAERYGAQYEAISSLDVRVIPNSRHFIMLDQPEAFADALAAIVGDAQ